MFRLTAGVLPIDSDRESSTSDESKFLEIYTIFDKNVRRKTASRLDFHIPLTERKPRK